MYLSMTLLEVVINAEQSKSASWTIVIWPLLPRFVRLIAATPAIIMTEPIICQTPAVSLKRTIPKTNDRTAESTFVTVTTERSAFLKTFKIINQLSESKKPFRAKIKTNLRGIFIPKGSQIKLSKNDTDVKSTRITDSGLFLTACFLNIL